MLYTARISVLYLEVLLKRLVCKVRVGFGEAWPVIATSNSKGDFSESVWQFARIRTLRGWGTSEHGVQKEYGP